MLNNEQFERLSEFLIRKRARQRIILYLLANNYTIRDICTMDFKTLLALKVNSDLEVYVEEIKSLAEYHGLYGLKKHAFAYPGGKEFVPQDIYRIVRQATARFFGKNKSIEDFINYVRKG